MPPPLQIEEIYRRSEQGVLRPFLCMASDQQHYFVKGRGAGVSGLVAEFIGGRLAHLCGLPVPFFSILQVDAAAIEGSELEGLGELGPGLAFGSLLVESAQEISSSTLSLIPTDLQQSILVFDWWIRNEDRHYGAYGGNPNLLWDYQQKELVVIDHHAAFDADFSRKNFIRSHIFRHHLASFSEPEFQQIHTARLAAALAHLDTILAGLPEPWSDYLEEFSAHFDLRAVRSTLNLATQASFWEIEP